MKQDDRTKEQKKEYTYLIGGRDAVCLVGDWLLMAARMLIGHVRKKMQKRS